MFIVTYKCVCVCVCVCVWDDDDDGGDKDNDDDDRCKQGGRCGDHTRPGGCTGQAQLGPASRKVSTLRNLVPGS